jgi:hypothetical protein
MPTMVQRRMQASLTMPRWLLAFLWRWGASFSSFSSSMRRTHMQRSYIQAPSLPPNLSLVAQDVKEVWW